MTPPNIVVIMADDLGFGDLGRFNFGATRTPAIDSLAADGTVLTQHYSASPICAPAGRRSSPGAIRSAAE